MARRFSHITESHETLLVLSAYKEGLWNSKASNLCPDQLLQVSDYLVLRISDTILEYHKGIDTWSAGKGHCVKLYPQASPPSIGHSQGSVQRFWIKYSWFIGFPHQCTHTCTHLLRKCHVEIPPQLFLPPYDHDPARYERASFSYWLVHLMSTLHILYRALEWKQNL